MICGENWSSNQLDIQQFYLTKKSLFRVHPEKITWGRGEEELALFDKTIACDVIIISITLHHNKHVTCSEWRPYSQFFSPTQTKSFLQCLQFQDSLMKVAEGSVTLILLFLTHAPLSTASSKLNSSTQGPPTEILIKLFTVEFFICDLSLL